MKAKIQSKKIMCSECGLRIFYVDPSTETAICPRCVQQRIQILNEVGSDLFGKIFYKLPKVEGRQLLYAILQSKREGTLAGDKLKEARKRKGWSQSSLAVCLGVCKTAVVAMENNRKPLNIKALDMITNTGE